MHMGEELAIIGVHFQPEQNIVGVLVSLPDGFGEIGLKSIKDAVERCLLGGVRLEPWLTVQKELVGVSRAWGVEVGRVREALEGA